GIRIAAFVLAAACAAGIVYEYVEATDFPTAEPVTRVDAALVAWLREHPGVHRALAPDARIEVALDLHEDALNREVYGTEVDLREAVPRRAIHIQRKGERGAIHADAWNPAAGAVYKLAHGTLDGPVIPLAAGLLAGIVLGSRRRGGAAGRSPGGPA
ncbi:MAG TPA: hypothetical protein VHF22_13065, partial [Planctomycetota bacterium]|nr:hypothetical protein [Planctomycetota bacterium]